MWTFGYAALVFLPRLVLGNLYTASNVVSLLTTNAESISVAGGMDLPKLTPTAASLISYDWWYFDAVSASTNASITVVFFNSGPAGFNVLNLLGPYSVMITGSYDDGTPFGHWMVPAPGGMSLTSDSNGTISAEWKGAGATFQGTSLTADTVQYNIQLDMPLFGVKGNISLKARAPSHYACGPNTAGQAQQIAPTVYWSNAVPDAETVVDMTVDGKRLSITDGIGYHDKNWGTAPLLSAIKNWYWGHAYLAPYSVVWFDVVDSAGVEHVSGYVVKDGKVLASSCADNAVKARPWGANSQYPPTVLTGNPQGLSITFQLDQGPFVVNLTTATVTLDIALYRRFLGDVVGGFVGGSQYQGRAHWELFAFSLL